MPGQAHGFLVERRGHYTGNRVGQRQVAGPQNILNRRFPGRRADHAEAAVVINVGRFQADAGKLTHQISLLGGQARSAEYGNRSLPVLGLTAAGGGIERIIVEPHEGAAQEILTRLLDSKQKSLKDDAAYQATMARVQAAAGDAKPHLRWFVEPFGYVETLRAAAGGRKKRGTDLLKVLANQGFSAIRGLGGFVEFATAENELVHRTFIFAPAVNKTGEKYNLAARMLKFPNSEDLAPPAWMPHQTTNYLTLNWKMQVLQEVQRMGGDPTPLLKAIDPSFTEKDGIPTFDFPGGPITAKGDIAKALADKEREAKKGTLPPGVRRAR